MIHFVTAYDPATRANMAVIRGVITETDPAGEVATRAELVRQLQMRPGEPLFAMTHGQPELLRAHLGEVAIGLPDTHVVGARDVFAWACHTASLLGREMSRAGATWWGYTGAIAAPSDAPDEIPIFEEVFAEIRERFASNPDEIKGRIRDVCDRAGDRLDAVDAAMDGYLCLLHIWDRLRIWAPGSSEAWHHPAAGPPVWMS